MVSVDEAVIARINRDGKKFEILVDPDKVQEVKAGKIVSPDVLLATPEIYEDAKKGLRVSKEEINRAFGTTDITFVANKIIRMGEVQLTTEQRRTMADEKRKAIASMISAKGVDPRSNVPHPIERVLRAMDEAKVRIDVDKSPEEQIDAVVKAIQPIIPIKFEMINIAVRSPAKYAGKVANVVRNFGKVKKEEWGSDGSFGCLLEIPTAAQQEVYDKLNSLTHGEIGTRVIKKEDLKV